jgi:hypothetical protein
VFEHGYVVVLVAEDHELGVVRDKSAEPGRPVENVAASGGSSCGPIEFRVRVR